jgi:arylsulfatase A-like enzyme
LALAAISCGGDDDPFALGPHPIVLIDLSSVRADRLGAYGSERPTSPRFDALAAESLRFEWAFASSPDGVPAQGSILTGRYPAGNGQLSESATLPPEVDTLAELLRAAGWQTAAFVDGGYLSAGFGYDQGFEVYEDGRGKGLAESAAKAAAWLEGRAGSAEPFFLLLHGSDALPPFAPPAAARELVAADAAPATAGFEPTLRSLAALASSLGGEAPANGDLAYAAALYDAELRAIDDTLGAFLDRLRELGVLERATVVVISDHGQELGEHGATLNEGVYATTTRVPFLMRLPGALAAQPVERVVQTADLAPTLLDLTGVAVPNEMQGSSLVPWLRGQGRPPYVAFSDWARPDGALAMTMAGYRLVAHRIPASPNDVTDAVADGGDIEAGDTAEATSPYRVELYHLLADPLEQHDLAAVEPQKTAVMLRRLEEWQRRMGAAASGEGEADSLDEERLQQLRDLGYIQ